jgi:hypothetical protein
LEQAGVILMAPLLYFSAPIVEVIFMKHEDMQLELQRIHMNLEGIRNAVEGIVEGIMNRVMSAPEDSLEKIITSDSFIRQMRFLLGQVERNLNDTDALMDFAEDPEDFRILCKIHAETEDDRKLLSKLQNRLDILEDMGS